MVREIRDIKLDGCSGEEGALENVLFEFGNAVGEKRPVESTEAVR